MGWNDQIIKEFRENNGRVGGMFEGTPLVVITTAGVRTGKPHTTPVVYYADGERYLVFGSNNGRPTHPDWYHNILGIGQVTMEIGSEEGHVRPLSACAVVLEGEERDRYWELQCARDPAFRAYEEKSARVIPVVALYPLDLSKDPARNRMIGEQLIVHHQELRAELARVRAAIDAVRAGGTAASTTAEEQGAAPELAEQLRKHCLTFCWDMQMHHTREQGSFTAFERQYPHLAPVLRRLRAEHVVVEQALAAFEELLGRGMSGTPAEVGQVQAELDRVVADLEEHFAYEEERLIPALNGVVG
jgi:deazaflavin-dependent oxidoreductase (nitroreductase family)